MRGFLIRLIVSVVGLWIASAIVPGLDIDGVESLFLAAILLGLVNAFVRPFLIVVTLPLTVLSMGLFLLVVNTAMLAMVAGMMDDFSIDGFFAALLGSLIVSVVSWYASVFIGPAGNVEYINIRKDYKD